MRLLLIEDNLAIHDIMRDELKKHRFALDCVASGIDGLEMIAINEYDAIILDLNLPDIDGLEICRKLRQQNISMPLIMATARRDITEKIQGLNEGADDYLVKPYDYDELAARIFALIRRSKGKVNPQVNFGDIIVDPHTISVTVNNVTIKITPKEFDVLYYLMLTAPKVSRIEEIIEHSWAEEINPFSNTARVHLINLRKKIAQYSQEVTLVTIKNKGYHLCLK